MSSNSFADGGEAATVTRTARDNLSAPGERHSNVLTVGAALKWVMPSSFRIFHMTW